MLERKGGISQKELMAQIKKVNGRPISPQYLNDIEHNRRVPSGDHLLREMARASEISYVCLRYLADSWPEDVRDEAPTQEESMAAYRAFGKPLKE